MPNYDFKMLSDYEFELLTRDLLMKELKCNLESFQKGRDQGIDLRYSKNLENSIIIQCKHYANSKYSDLKKSILNELPKLEKLKPKRYILVTSLGSHTISPTCFAVPSIFSSALYELLLSLFFSPLA